MATEAEDDATLKKLLSGLQRNQDALNKALDRNKAEASVIRAELKKVSGQIAATIRGDTEINLFNMPKEAAAPETAVPKEAKPPKGWRAAKLAELAGVSQKDAEGLATLKLKTVKEWGAHVNDKKLDDMEWGDLGKAGAKRVDKAVQDFLAGKTQPAETSAE